MSRILMIAAEHGGLPGGKVGGIGDVIAQLPQALRAQGNRVDILLPSYGVYHEEHYSRQVAEVSVQFAGAGQRVTLHRMHCDESCWIVHHPIFGSPAGQIYHHDPQDAPFATDANIYALFCASAVRLLEQSALPKPDVAHLHDWHAATFALLAKATKSLNDLPLVYTVHNLALQGVRPLQGHPSSLESWFGDLNETLSAVIDPRHPDCYNPMRAGIVLCDKVHVVSPTYAKEVLEPNDATRGFHGGEGLELDLQRRAKQGDLVGILNGCEYSSDTDQQEPGPESSGQQRRALPELIDNTLADWFADNDALRSCDYLARETLKDVRGSMDDHILVTSVGRMTHQKLGLLLHRDSRGKTLLDRLLGALGGQGVMVLLGSGEAHIESELVRHAARHNNLLFLRGYSEDVADAMYSAGDLFLMPSLYEPCGIAQMLAMRAAQPCLVHATGGLVDTVDDGVDGIKFAGDSLDDKARSCEQAFERALALHANTEAYLAMRNSARNRRTTWQDAACAYNKHLYNLSGSLADRVVPYPQSSQLSRAAS